MSEDSIRTDVWFGPWLGSVKRECEFWASLPERLGYNWPARDWLPRGSVWTDEA